MNHGNFVMVVAKNFMNHDLEIRDAEIQRGSFYDYKHPRDAIAANDLHVLVHPADVGGVSARPSSEDESTHAPHEDMGGHVDLYDQDAHTRICTLMWKCPSTGSNEFYAHNLNDSVYDVKVGGYNMRGPMGPVEVGVTKRGEPSAVDVNANFYVA